MFPRNIAYWSLWRYLLTNVVVNSINYFSTYDKKTGKKIMTVEVAPHGIGTRISKRVLMILEGIMKGEALE